MNPAPAGEERPPEGAEPASEPPAKKKRGRFGLPRPVYTLGRLLILALLVEYLVVPQLAGPRKILHLIDQVNPLLLLAGMLYLELPLRRLPLALAWTAGSGVVLFLLLMAIQLHATSQRAGSVLTSSLVFPLLFLGGSMFPFEVMPDRMATIGRRTPNGWALQSLKDILFGRADAAELGAALAVLLAVALALFLLCERRMRRVFVGS